MNSTQLQQYHSGERIAFDENASTKAFAQQLDKEDPLARFRGEYLIPSKADLKDPHPEKKAFDELNNPKDACIYLCGNSLGLQPKRTRHWLNEECTIWGARGVYGHFDHPLQAPWVEGGALAVENMAKIVGAKPEEVAVLGSLTENIHFLFAGFYKPEKEKAGARTKVIIEGKAFPSDHYAVESQIQWHGLDPKEELVCIFPRKDEYTLRTEDILAKIDEHATTAALIFLSGVQFYTGQFFDVKTITEYAQKKGITVGWDFAHAVGNVPLQCHEWGIDFASWCTYKYLCSGPGGMSGIFIHEKNASPDRHRLAGWWGHDKESRFKMENTFKAIPGAAGYQLSNPSIFSLTSLRASLSVFSETSMSALRQKSLHLTSYLEHLLQTQILSPSSQSESNEKQFKIITPNEPEARGCQLSLLFREGLMMPVFTRLSEEGIIVDERKPDVIRVAPKPMYNGFAEVWEFVQVLKRAIEDAS